MNKRAILPKLGILSSLFLGFSLLISTEFSSRVFAATSEAKTTIPTAKQQPIQLIAQQTVQIDLLAATLQGCNRQGTSVNCNLLFTSNSDSNVRVYCLGDSILTDTSGNDYTCQKINIANVIETNGSYADYKFNQGIPKKVVVTFNEIPTQIEQIAIFELLTFDRRSYWNRVSSSVP
jgi:hypothetical protein